LYDAAVRNIQESHARVTDKHDQIVALGTVHKFILVINQSSLVAVLNIKQETHQEMRQRTSTLFTTTSSTIFTQCAPEATEFGEITQNNGHYAVQGYSMSPILVAIESSHMTSY